MKKLFFLCLLPAFTLAKLNVEACSEIKDHQEGIECYLQLLKENPNPKERLIIKEKTNELLGRMKTKLYSWKYKESKDKMRGINSFSATIASQDEIALESSDTKAMSFLALTKISNKNDIMVVLMKAFFDCKNETCEIAAKFDDGNIEHYNITQLSSDTPGTFIISGEKQIKSFASKIKTAKNLIIEVPIYNYGKAQFEFNVEGLDWEHF